MKILQNILKEMGEGQNANWEDQMVNAVESLNKAIKEINQLRFHKSVEKSRDINMMILDAVNKGDEARLDLLELVDKLKLNR